MALRDVAARSVPAGGGPSSKLPMLATFGLLAGPLASMLEVEMSHPATDPTRPVGSESPAVSQRRDTPPSRHRTGPLGRLARLGLAGVFALTFFSIVDARGSARFRNPHILGEPSAWVLHAVMAVTFVILVGALASALAGDRARRRWQAVAIVAMIATVAVAAAIGRATEGAVWGFPLADLVWWFDVVMLVEQFIATVLAVGLGTSGCEVGVWPELLARFHGEPAGAEDGLACIVGLHLLDEWESRRRTQRALPVGEAKRR